MKSLEDVEVEGKTVLLRTDLNLPIENGEPEETVRFKRYLETIEEISERGGRTVVMAHQGRPARKDFLSLEKHAEHLSKNLGQEVEFVRSFFGPRLGDAIASMQNGDIVMLENIRFLSEELQNLDPERHSKDFFVQKMAKYFDLCVEDGFSAAHRSHGSIVGFPPLIESCAGIIMERELQNCRKVRDELDDPVLVLGGDKPADIVRILDEMIENVDKVLLGGIPGELALTIQGKELGRKSEWLNENGFKSKEEELSELLEDHGEKFVLPDDLEVETGESVEAGEISENEICWDIGRRTRERFRKEIRSADTVLMKGPMGSFEDYPDGTRAVIDAIAEAEAFTVLGGGHTSSLVHKFGHNLDEFSHVSIAGGAFVRLMAGEDLPAVEALEKYS